MAIAFVQGKGTIDNSGTLQNLPLAYAINPTAGNLLVVWAFAQKTAVSVNITSITDTIGNTWTRQALLQTGAAHGTAAIYTAVNTTTAANTVQVNTDTANENTIQIGISEYSGQAVGSPVDTASTPLRVVSASPYASSNIVTSYTNETIIGIGSTDQTTGRIVTAGGGFTLRVDGNTPAAVGFVLEDKAVSTAGTYNSAWSDSDGFAIIAAIGIKSTTSVFSGTSAGWVNRQRRFVNKR